jgi:hypothetical protein
LYALHVIGSTSASASLKGNVFAMFVPDTIT